MRIATVIGPVLVWGGSVSFVGAQIPGAPVLQNGFLTPGLIVAADGGVGWNHGLAGAAASYSPNSRSVALSAALGAGFPQGPAFAYGVRATLPIPVFARRGAFGLVGFLGLGGLLGSTTIVDVPIGVGVGYRHALGANRGISVYATPFYLIQRSGGSDGSFRTGLGTDVTVTPRVGVTLGADAGTRGGPRFGAGLAYLISR
ncbi:MAG TPA: hypothetical protein VNW46_00685 [Gemmatimonadaceae bacterium]|jgi:hypothetical protein|nr:hypothetical protein [Gemmatimonadaceae bacterium]